MRLILAACVVTAVSAGAVAGGLPLGPDALLHTPGSQVFGEAGGITMREPEVAREDETVELWVRISFSFTYDRVAVYYTTDGSTPSGSFGTGSGSTQVLRSDLGGVAFVRNEPGSIDWWKATLPASARQYGQTVRYTIGAWQTGGGAEVFANNSGCGDGVCDNPAAPATVFSFTNKLAWPGAGFGSPTPGAGYPPAHFWKEEGVVGNNSINVMIDQNGSMYDVYYPSAGAVQGISTRNEGYADGGIDEFPACVVDGQRGQMHLNFGSVGLRVDGTTYWLSNQAGAAYTGVNQSWVGDSNVIQTGATLGAGGNSIGVQQYDFAPKGIAYPTTDGGAPNPGLYVKRIVLTNNGPVAKDVSVYCYLDWALNGGDGFDGAFTDNGRGAMVAYDNTYRAATNGNGCGFGDYNPTTFPSYDKDVSVFLAAAMKSVPSVGGGGGAAATDFWSDTSGDQDRGWVGLRVNLPAGVSREVNVAMVGGFDDFPGAAAGPTVGTYGFQMDGPIDWFLAGNMSAVQSATVSAWQSWLGGGVSFSCPDPAYVELFKRGLLGTALHLDGKNGGIIAGMHNGAYPYVWPRDAVWAAITLARTGFTAESREIYRFLRDVAYRDMEPWGRRGFWKQKYTTDGYTAWGNPQVDETSCYPWGARFIYGVTGDISFLQDHYDEVYEAAISSSQTSGFDGRLRYDGVFNLVDSMSLWEDAFGLFNYSNASVVRGLEDAAAIADVLDQNVCPGGPGQCGYHADKALFLSRATAVRAGLDARLAWNGENTDISQIGIVYPMSVYPPGHPRAELIVDRFNGVATDAFGNNHPIMNFAGGAHPEWEGLVNRYWGDGYWNGGPWFLSTLWYGAYYAQRNNVTAGTADIDNHKHRMDRCIDMLGPMGFGAEQIAGNNGQVYGAGGDFRLQTAWPNAWESMSFLTDSIMLFLDWTPDAASDTLRIRPKLPSSWSFMEFANISLGAHRIDVRVTLTPDYAEHRFTNRTGAPVAFDTVVRLPVGSPKCAVLLNGAGVASTYNAGLNSVAVSAALATGANAITTLRVLRRAPADVSRNGVVDFADITAVLVSFGANPGPYAGADTNGDGIVNFADITAVLVTFGSACP